jgi:hypothetical protein
MARRNSGACRCHVTPARTSEFVPLPKLPRVKWRYPKPGEGGRAKLASSRKIALPSFGPALRGSATNSSQASRHRHLVTPGRLRIRTIPSETNPFTAIAADTIAAAPLARWYP